MQRNLQSCPRSRACIPRIRTGPGQLLHGRPAGPGTTSRRDRLCKELRAVTAGQRHPRRRSGAWSMDADGNLFRLVSEAKRISLAYLFDPFLAVQTSSLRSPAVIGWAQLNAVRGDLVVDGAGVAGDGGRVCVDLVEEQFQGAGDAP